MYPTGKPTDFTFNPTKKPTTPHPSKEPSIHPTNNPNSAPTDIPTIITNLPSITPTLRPTGPTIPPSGHPTPPTASVSPTHRPTPDTKEPTKKPTTGTPTLRPTTLSPVAAPTKQPSMAPLEATETPTLSTLMPSGIPTITPTDHPSETPTQKPTNNPTKPAICGTVITPQMNDIIVCDKHCNKCEVLCTESYQCKSVKIYSSAKNTSVLCSGSNSCNDLMVNIGDNGVYPFGYDSNLFNGIEYDVATIDCVGKTSCLKLNVNINGRFLLGAEVDADSGGQDSLKDASIDVYFDNSQIFNLNCGESEKNCYASSMVNCYKQAICHCNDVNGGNLGGCALVADNVVTHSYVITIVYILGVFECVLANLYYICINYVCILVYFINISMFE